MYQEKRLYTSASPVPLIQKSVHLPGKYHASFSVPSQVGGAGETTTTAFATSAEAYSSVFVSHLVSISLFPGYFVGTHLRYPYREGSPIHSANAHWQCRKSSGTAVAKFPLLILHVPTNKTKKKKRLFLRHRGGIKASCGTPTT